jgi:hypothetical protein
MARKARIATLRWIRVYVDKSARLGILNLFDMSHILKITASPPRLSSERRGVPSTSLVMGRSLKPQVTNRRRPMSTRKGVRQRPPAIRQHPQELQTQWAATRANTPPPPTVLIGRACRMSAAFCGSAMAVSLRSLVPQFHFVECPYVVHHVMAPAGHARQLVRLYRRKRVRMYLLAPDPLNLTRSS